MLVRIVGALCVLCMLTAWPAAAQNVAIPGEDLAAYRDTLDLLIPQPFPLRPFVLPGSESVYLDGTRLDTTQYRLDYRRGHLRIDGLVPDPRRTLVAVYRTFGFRLRDTYRRRALVAPAAADTAGAVSIVERPTRNGAPASADGSQLQRSGSITRGLLVGNNRDATVESGLRMQVSGEVAEGIRVQAVLTDENTPILPEGTTQRLNEFDRVFIQIEARQGTAQLGDFDLRFQGSTFARFARKLQGITVFGDLPDPAVAAVGGGRLAVAGATARGIFQTQDLIPIEGVQGPYRLEGKSGERFIIVIPGSEEVYLDGVRLDRGESNDYVIDYATGELTFTSSRIITGDDRLTVEFQYRTTEFTRTLLGAEVDVGFWQRADGTARARLGATFLREADSRQFNEEFGLTEEDEAILAVIGDSTAAQSGAVAVEYDPEAPFVQYVRRDTTLQDGTADRVFVALTAAPPDTVTVFRVRFTRVGSGNGRYVRRGQAVNGILYEYAGPGRGEYEPIRLLPKPKQQRLFDLRGGFEPVRGVELFGEWAQSLNDQNRLSDADGGDDVGAAYLGGVRLRPLNVGWGDVELGQVSAEVRRRFTGDHFATFDRTQPVEFARRWNLDPARTGRGGQTVQVGDETIDEAELEWSVTPRSRLSGEVGRLRSAGTFDGRRWAVSLQAGEERWPRLLYRVERISSDDASTGEVGRWLRQLGRLEQPLLAGRLVPRVEIEHEDRRQRITAVDSLTGSSFAFVEYRPGLAWKTGTLEVGGTLELRTEDLWLDGDLRDAGRAWTAQTEFDWRPGRAFSTDGSVGFRRRAFTDAFVEQGRQAQSSVVLRWNGRFQPGPRILSLDWFYEALTERTPVLQEIYVRTGPELGEFVWEDGNGDGAIQIDEFIPERTQDEGTYVRTFIPSDTLRSVISVQTRAIMQLDPGKAWRGAASGWKRWLSNVSTRTTVQIQEKSEEDRLSRIYLLKQRFFRDPRTTLKGLLRFSQDVTLFRNTSRYGLDLSYNLVRNLTVLEAGEESRFVNRWQADGTLRPVQRLGLRLSAAWEHNRTGSQAFRSRRFDISGVSLEPEVSFNPSSSLQLSAGMAYSRKTDALEDRRATVWKVPLTGRFTQVRRLSLSGRVEVAEVALSGQADGLANFELTDGRGAGTSFLWNLSGWYQLSRLLRATLSYNGRAPADAPTLHTVRLQLSAVF